MPKDSEPKRRVRKSPAPARATRTTTLAPAANNRLSREDWLTAALHQIAEQGLAGVNIGSLAERLHVTTGSFYWHFGSRDEIIEIPGIG